MSTSMDAEPKARPIIADLALVIGVFIIVAGFMSQIVLIQLIYVAVGSPLAGLLALVVGLRLGAWSRLTAGRRFAIGTGMVCAGSVGYLLAIPFYPAEGPAVFDLAFWGGSLVLVAGYGLLIGALLRALVVRLRRIR